MRRLVVIGLAALGLVVLTSPSATAHALLRASEPPDGALLDSPPAELVLEFTEEPDLRLSRIGILDTSGRRIETARPEKTPGDPRRLRIPLPDLPNGSYTVSWRVLSTVDGHVTSGAFAFGVGVSEIVGGAGSEGTVVETARPSVLAVAGRWGLYWSLALLLSASLFSLVILRRNWHPQGPLLIGAWAIGGLGLLALLLAESAAAEAPIGALLGSERGRVLLLRGGGLVLTGAVLILALRRKGRWPMVALGASTAAVMLIQAYAGHAGGATSMRWAKVSVQWIHLLASGAWVGGLVWLLLASRGRDARELGPSVARFSTLAGIAVAAVALTGALRAVDELGGIRALGSLDQTGFGLTVVGKVALFLPLLAMGAFNRYRTVPALKQGEARVGTLRRVVTGEVALAVGIFGVTGVMAGLAPPGYQTGATPEETRVEATGSDFGTSVRVHLVVTPGTPGPNRFEAHLTHYDSGEPLAARHVRLRFSLPGRPDIGGSELHLSSQGPGMWVGQGSNLSVEGRWRIGVLIEQEGDSLEVPLEVETLLPEQDITVSEAPGQPTLYTITLPPGISVQGYVDPGAPGANEVHFTFFSPEGGEQPVEQPRLTAALLPEGPTELESRELSPGHLVAPVELVPGDWRFRVEAVAPDGSPLSAYFQLRIE